MRHIFLTIPYLLISFYSYSQAPEISGTEYNMSIQYYNQGRSLFIEGEQIDQAIRLFKNAISLNPTNSDFHFLLSKSYLKKDKLDSAIYYISNAIQLASGQADYYNHAAYVYFLKKDYSDAQKHFDKAINFNDKSDVKINLAMCFFNKGVCNLQLKQNELARNDLKKSTLINDSYAPAFHNLAITLVRLEQFEAACTNFQKAKGLGSSISSKFIDRYCPD